MQQAQQGLSLAQPAAQVAAQGARAFKDMTEGAAATGADPQDMMARLQEAVAQDPQAQAKLQRLAQNAMQNIEANVDGP